MSYATVLLDGPTEPLTYRLTPETLTGAIPGALVEVPFGPRTSLGVVLKLERSVPTALKEKLRPIKKVLSSGVWAPPTTIRLAQAMAIYSGEPTGLCLFRLLPPAGKRMNNHVRPSISRLPPKTLHVYGHRAARLKQYRTLITRAIAGKRQVIVVAPVSEHGWLENQLIGSRRHLGGGQAIHLRGVPVDGSAEDQTTHLGGVDEPTPVPPPSRRACPELDSGGIEGDLIVRVRAVSAELAPGEQRKIAEDLATGLIDVLITTRHAIGWPAYALGAVIIDDPYHMAHSDEQRPYLDSATIALLRSTIEGGYCVLGTSLPTPALLLREQRGLARRLTMRPDTSEEDRPFTSEESDRFRRGGVNEPTSIRILTASDKQLIVPELIHLLDEALEQDKGAALITPRRGVGGQVRCTDCARTVNCTICGEEMGVRTNDRQHLRGDQAIHLEGVVDQSTARASDLLCGACGASSSMPERCPSCNGQQLRVSGIGVESVKGWLTKHAPELLAKGLVVDSEGLLEQERSFGVIAFVFADSPLSSPDLERPIRYLSSIIEAQGSTEQVVVQTRSPAESWLRSLSNPQALLEVLHEREAGKLPPFVRTLHLSGPIAAETDALGKLADYDLGRTQRRGDELHIDLHYAAADHSQVLTDVRQKLGRGWHIKVDSILEYAAL